MFCSRIGRAWLGACLIITLMMEHLISISIVESSLYEASLIDHDRLIDNQQPQSSSATSAVFVVL